MQLNPEEYELESIDDGMINYYADRGNIKLFRKEHQEFNETRRELKKQGFRCVDIYKDKFGIIHHIYTKKKGKNQIN